MERLKESETGITLIALAIMIIVLLILATISIATLTGENGVLTKASKTEKETDITDTKEQIKIELMGTLDKEKTNYTNDDVIATVEKITGHDVEKNASNVQSKKGNDVDISDLWVKEQLKCYFQWDDFEDNEWITRHKTILFQEGDTWTDNHVQNIVDTLNTIYAMISFQVFDSTIEFYQGGSGGGNIGRLKCNGISVKLGDKFIADAIYEILE